MKIIRWNNKVKKLQPKALGCEQLYSTLLDHMKDVDVLKFLN